MSSKKADVQEHIAHLKAKTAMLENTDHGLLLQKISNIMVVQN